MKTDPLEILEAVVAFPFLLVMAIGLIMCGAFQAALERMART